MTWSEAFRGYLEKIGLTQQDALFALRRAKIKATASQISYWSRGTYPRESTRVRLERWSKGEIRANLPAAPISSLDVVEGHRLAG